MRKLLLFLISVFLLPIVLGVGGWDEGGWDEGGWDFGTPAPEVAPSPAPSGGGGGGGSGTYIPSTPSAPITYTLNLIKGQIYNFNINGEIHTYSITYIDVENQIAQFVFESEKKVLSLSLNQSEFLDYNNDNFYDLEITLTKIYGSEIVEVKMKTIHLEIPSGVAEPIKEEILKEEKPKEVIPVEEGGKIEVLPPEIPKEAPQKPRYILLELLLLIIIITLIIVGIFYSIRKKDKSEKEDDKQQKGNKREDKH